MLTDEIRSRLEALNRRPLPAAPRFDPPATVPPATVPPKFHFLQLGNAGGAQAESAFPAGEEHENCSGKHWRVRQPLAQFWPAADACIPRGGLVPEWSFGQPDFCHPELAAFAESFPRGTLFLDLETCGFAGSMVFLIGLIRRHGESLVLDQLFARNYAEERAILHTLWEIAAQNQVLVTFNGKSFDWPMVHDRSILHRLDHDDAVSVGDSHLPQLVHCDLLHHARRRWKGVLPNCKLQTLERLVCRRHRREDIGGAQIPLAYHDFVRGGAAGPIRSVLQHNALDLVTLVEVVLALARGGSAEARDGQKKAANLPKRRSRPE